MIRNLEALLKPLRTRLANLVARAVVQLVADGGKLQVVQLGLLEGETREAVERVQEYGFTSHPHPGAEAVVLFVGGRRDHGLVVAVDDRRHRKVGLEAGEVALYTDEGDCIVLRRGRVVEVKAGTKLRIEAPAFEVVGDTVTLLEGSTPVAKEGSATTGHVHTLAGTAGPFALVGTAVLQVDTIAAGAGSQNVKVP